MPSTDSDNDQKVDGMRRIQWTASIGLGGRHAPDSVAAFPRITQFMKYQACQMDYFNRHERNGLLQPG